MSQEIERKFLVKELPADLENYSHSAIIQGYLIVTDNDIEVRLRKKGDKYFETVKAGSGLVRKESEKEIT
ncbi:MAG: adenylate cyclase, partial [Candidatus Dadabacteria bacterium]|nr:adenylate cyclase [Candidatus Dadabacteria bacterium]